MPAKETVLLTGASGFIGSHVAAALLQDGYKVYAPLRAQSFSKISSLRKHENFYPLKGAFYEPALLNSLDAAPDFVLHLAAIRGGGRANETAYRRVNIQGTQTLIDFARRRQIKGFLYLSTVGVLGTIPQAQPASENNPPQPDGRYHQSKWQGEEIVRQAAAEIPCLILRPTITYGRGDDGFIFKLRHLIRRKRMVLPATPVMVHLLSVDALCCLITHILQNRQFNGKSYIVADKEPVPLQSVAEIITRSGGKYLALPKAIFRAADRLLATFRQAALRTSVQLISSDWIYDISAAIQELRYQPRNTLTELQRRIEKYDNQND